MNFARLSLRARLALALVGVSVLAAGFATLLGNLGLEPRLNEAAHARLQRSADHFAEVASTVYRDSGGWTPPARRELAHLAALDGLRAEIATPRGPVVRVGSAPTGPRAGAPVVVRGTAVGRVSVATTGGKLLTPAEAHLQNSLDRLHLAAAGAAIAVALLVAFVLAQALARPLRLIRQTAERIEGGDIAARVELSGDPETRSVGGALNRLAETLEHQEEIRRASVADLAHELRTPVNSILVRIEAAQDGLLAGPENLASMHGEAVRLTRLLDDISRLADAERPGLLLEKQEVDLAAVARAEADSLAPRFAERSINFIVGLDSVFVLGNSARLGQIASNLLVNALRYTEPGGKVVLNVRTDSDEAVLEVTDTGIGIAPDDLGYIFTRFWRGDKSRSRATGGTGIGLAIVRELVRAHDGRIEVESVQGRGSCFRVSLRRRARASAHTAFGYETSASTRAPGAS